MIQSLGSVTPALRMEFVAMHADAGRPNTAQQQKLCEMLHCVFTEIRYLSQAGRSQQAADLADAFHNLPHEIWADYFSLAYFRTAFVEPYYRRWPKGSYDYHALLDEVAALA